MAAPTRSAAFWVSRSLTWTYRSVIRTWAWPRRRANHRNRHAGDDGVARKRVAQVVQAHVVETCRPADLAPNRQFRGARCAGILRRGKHVRPNTRLPHEDGSGGGVEENGARSRFALSKVENIVIHLGPTKGDQLPFAAAGQQEEADNVALLPAGAATVVRSQRGV